MMRGTCWLDLPSRGTRAVALCAALLLAATGALGDRAVETIREGALRSIVDADVVSALEATGRVRIVVAFAPAPGEPMRARPDAARARLAGTGFRPGRRYERIPSLVGSIDAAALAALLADPHVVRVSLERVVSAQLAEAVPLVRLDALHLRGFVGSGSTVAVVDTGVDLAHPDLAGAVIAERCFCDDGVIGPAGCCPNGQDQQSGPGSGQDDHGHGTRIAGIVTSAGVHAPQGGAPDSLLIAVKVLNASGEGMAGDLLAGLDWILVNHPEVPVLNMSLGFGLYAGDCDMADAATMAFASAVDQLHKAGVLTVAGSGNNGSGTGMIAPACIANAVSVGAVWDANEGSQTWLGCTDATTAADMVTCWSNSSTTTDVFAPGARMTSSLLGSTSVTLAGTSYATAVVSACAAVLADAHPTASMDDLAAAVLVSGVSVVDTTNGLAFPRLDCMAAHTSLSPGIPAVRGAPLLGVALLLAASGAAALKRATGVGASPPGSGTSAS